MKPYLELKIWTDGGSRGNPGPSAGGYVIRDAKSRLIEMKGVYVGEATCNQAEYAGLIAALKAAHVLNATDVTVHADSKLIVCQVGGSWKVKNQGLFAMYDEARALANGFESFRIIHIPREQNALADEMANKAMDRKAAVAEAC